MFCLIHRWKINRALDDNQSLSARANPHLERCPTCRAHHQQQVQLIQQLEQPATQPEAPVYLRARILNEIQTAEAAPAPAHSLPVWVPIAACAVIAFFLYPRPTPLPTPANPHVAAVEHPTLPSVEIPELNMARALEAAHETVTSPYDQELQNLQDDLQAASAYFGRLIPIRLATND